MKKVNDFKVNDKIILLDKRKGIIIDKISEYYYQVKTYDDTSNETYFKIFYKDMQHE